MCESKICTKSQGLCVCADERCSRNPEERTELMWLRVPHSRSGCTASECARAEQAGGAKRAATSDNNVDSVRRRRCLAAACPFSVGSSRWLPLGPAAVAANPVRPLRWPPSKCARHSLCVHFCARQTIWERKLLARWLLMPRLARLTGR